MHFLLFSAHFSVQNSTFAMKIKKNDYGNLSNGTSIFGSTSKTKSAKDVDDLFRQCLEES